VDSQAPTAQRAAADVEGVRVLDRYRLTRRLGAGAFGTVWAARDERLERDVAVKILPRERVMDARFEREARAAARLTHPAIVTLYEAAVDDDGAYLVSELVRGRTLDDLLQRGQLSDRDILRVGLALCDALAHAHEQGVIHRDVKPSNVLVPARRRGGAHAAKLTDFGVAHVVGGDTLTATGDVVGTLAYMAPEQAEGRDAGPAADLYALALVIYEALTGVNPVRHAHPARARRLGVYLPPLRRQRRELPRELGLGIDLALRPRARERGTIEDLRRALAVALDRVEDTPGVVEPGWVADPEPEDAIPSAAGPQAGSTEAPPVAHPAVPWPVRGLNAASAGVAVAWLAGHLLAHPVLAPAALGLLATAAVLVLPRLGWLTVTAGVAAVAAAQGRSGAALLLAALVVAGVVVLPAAGAGHALPAGAGVLATLGVAGAWPAIAGSLRAPWWVRAAVAGSGFAWVAGAGAITGHDLLWVAGHPPAPGVWTGSAAIAARDVLAPLPSAGLLAGALTWAVAAIALPVLTGGRSFTRVAGGLLAWTVLTVVIPVLLGTALRAPIPGALLGAALAAAPGLARRYHLA
jgi:hypothetical protein